MFERGPNLWVVILAAGSGTRLASLTKALHGYELPKQYALLAGRRTLLQQTVERALSLTDPERIVIVVANEHRTLANQQLAEWPQLNVLVQPRNIGTGPGAVLPLALIRKADPAARVAVLPADHYVAQVDPLLDCLDKAAVATRLAPSSVTLVGAVPDAEDADYGWIVPGATVGRFGLRAVRHFVEKPGADEAERLHASGALWNTFMMVGLAETLWQMTNRAMPRHCQRISTAFDSTGRSGAELISAYRDLPPCDFSKHVLEDNPELTVLPLPAETGWSDWGTPRRVFQSLQHTRELERLLARISGPASDDSISMVA